MALIAPETIEQIAAANDIVDVIGSYFPLKRAGSSYRALCPFHQEKTPSFHVNPSRQSFHCFGCGAGGSVFRFVMNYENVDFPSAARRLAERAGIAIVEAQFSAEDDQRFHLRKRLLSLHQQAAQWFHENLLKSEEAKGARTYLKERGIGGEVAKAWKIGYAPESWDALTKWAGAEKFTGEELAKSGLVKLRDEEKADGEFYDRFRDRVMFPICNDLSEVIAFSGRVLQSDAQTAKYVNSPETMLFTKGNVLFGLHKSKRALADAGAAIVLEGQLDLITAFEAGVRNVVAPQGTAFTEKQARMLKRFVDEVVLCFDADSAGAKATERSLAALLDSNLVVRVATMPAGHDPDSLIRGEGAEAFTREIEAARDFFDFQIDRQSGTPEFATPRGKMEFARKMAESVSLVTDRVLRQAVANKVAARLALPPATFVAMLAKPAKEEKLENDPAVRAVVGADLVGNLARLALRDRAARDWMLGQRWRELLAGSPENALLERVLALDFTPGDAASIDAFKVHLDPDQARMVSALFKESMPEQPLEAALECWRRLEKQELQARLDTLMARQRAPNLAVAEIMALQKQILDLQKRVTDIARPFPQPA